MKKKSAEDYLDKLLNSVNDEKEKKEKFKETAKMLEDAMSFWDADIPDSELEEAEYEQLIAKENKKSEREDFLDALLSGAKDTEFGMNRRKPDTNPMYSRRVSKSEADFLREFEEELAGDGEDLADLFAEFEKAVEPEDKLEAQDIRENDADDGFTLGDVDLAALVNEVADVMSDEIPLEDNAVVNEEIPVEIPLEMESMMGDFATSEEPAPMEEISDDMFAELFGGDNGLNLADEIPTVSSTDEIDLGNLGEDDLMNLLAGADDLADIGNMLSKGEVTEISLDELDAFSVFAENEMSAQQISADPEIEEPENENKKGKKGDLLGKLKGLLGGLFKGEADDDEVALKSAKEPTAEMLSGENAAIFVELDAMEEKPAKKEKKKKEKKAKAPKKAKPKKQKAPKKPKPKKEKKPKEVDNTPPLPKGPVLMIWFMALSMVGLVLVGVEMISYNTPFSEAKSLQNQGHYAEAFTKLNGLEIKEKDMEFYNQLAVLATVDSEINAYEVFTKAEVVDKAFDSLICAAGRCDLNEEEADVYGCLGQLEILKKSVSNELQEKYDMTYEEAIKMYKIRHRDDYTIALYKKLTELGIEWD